MILCAGGCGLAFEEGSIKFFHEHPYCKECLQRWLSEYKVLGSGVPPAAPDEAERWEDASDEWTAAIKEAFPTRSGSHESWGIAMRMVGHRHAKGELVALVNFLLERLRRCLVSGDAGWQAVDGYDLQRSEWEEASERGGSVFRPRSFHLDCGGEFLETRTSSSSRGPWTCEKCGEVTNTIDPQHGAATFAKSTP